QVITKPRGEALKELPERSARLMQEAIDRGKPIGYIHGYFADETFLEGTGKGILDRLTLGTGAQMQLARQIDEIFKQQGIEIAGIVGFRVGGARPFRYTYLPMERLARTRSAVEEIFSLTPDQPFTFEDLVGAWAQGRKLEGGDVEILQQHFAQRLRQE